MKAFVVSLIVLSASSTVFAQTQAAGIPSSFTPITCEIGTLLAGPTGLMPSAQTFKLTAALQDPKNSRIEHCAKQTQGEIKLTLCASTAEFVGGFEVGLIVAQAAAPSEMSVASTSLLATRQNGRGLTEVNGGPAQVLSSVSERLFAAGIQAPTELKGDSSPLDEAVKEGIAAGVLKVDEPVLFELRGCQL
ncbi:MAG: hypothetical protein IPJ84_08835 [Bdellovibrionales bacterium]|nr:hypothetical protein [Bdellovibrionales bacterium]